MPEEMYPQESAAKPAAPETDTPETDKNEGETVLVAKSALGGECKVGDTYTMKVVGIYDDEAELAKVGDAGDSSEEESAESKIDNMATPEE